MKSMRLIAECVLVVMAVLCAVSCEKETDSLDEIIPGAVTDTTNTSTDTTDVVGGDTTDVVEKDTIDDTIKVTEYTFSLYPGSRSLTIDSLYGEYKIEGTTDWCSATLKNENDCNKLVIQVSRNTGIERHASIILQIGDDVQKIFVKQKGCGLSFSHGGGTETISLPGSVIWQIDGVTDWCNVEAYYVRDSCRISVLVSENIENIERSTTLTFTSDDDVYPVPVTQKDTAYIEILPQLSNLEFEHADTSVVLTVHSAKEWKVTGNVPTWCKISPMQGNNGDQVIISVDANNTYNLRETQFSFRSGTAVQKIDLTQDGALWTFRYYKSDINFGRTSSIVVFTLESAIDWTIEGETEWCKVSREKITEEEYKVSIQVSDNTSSANRYTTLTFKGSRTNSIKLKQYHNLPTAGKEIDLGLGVKWAAWNIDATAPEEYGGYYAWGEVSKKDRYSMENYKFKYSVGSYWEYIDIGADISRTQYDVAHVKWGNGWRMPTKAECEELRSRCTYVYGVLGESVGVFFIAPNGNSIYLPFGDYKYGDYPPILNSTGFYYTSNCKGDNAVYFFLTSGEASLSSFNKYNGLTIRPVIDY